VDKYSKEIRTKMMSSVKSKNTKLETKVSKELWREGYRFRKNVKSLFGKPDLAIKKYKIVVFIDSCFWHGCELHCRMPKSNEDYWVSKIDRNKKRDKEVTNYYQNRGWSIVRLWEHQLRNDFEGCMRLITKSLQKK
jgi:DNA mismatch endonuclease (patch repair protein)